MQTRLECVGALSPTAPITIQNLDKPAPTFSVQTRFRLSTIRFSFGRRSPHERDRASLISLKWEGCEGDDIEISSQRDNLKPKT